MATLNGQPINTSFNGLIKTTDNGIIGATKKVITDGLGNESTLSLGTDSASFTGDLDLTNATVTGLPDAGVQSVVAGTNVTVDNTDPANPIVNAIGGGGGGTTPAMGLSTLPPVKGALFGAGFSWRTWVTTTGYARNNINISNTLASYSVFPLAEGQKVNAVQFFVSTAVAEATCWVSFYKMELDAASDTLIMTDRLLDLGTVSAATTGVKTINLGTAYTMLSQTYGAIGIVIGSSAAGVQISSWSNAVWSGNGGSDNTSAPDGTFYRAVGLSLSYTGGTSPTSLATNTYSQDTNNALYIVIR
jgi:hypothetical protein